VANAKRISAHGGAWCAAEEISVRIHPTVSLLVLLAPPLAAQTPAPCTFPPSSFEYAWGGETRQVFQRTDPATVSDPSTHRVWTVGDGGLIRHRDSGAAQWVVQQPPIDVTQTLLDVWFRPYPNWDEGWACGVGGHMLHTVNGGQTWQHQDSGVINNARSIPEPATLWRTRFSDSGQGLTCGLWTFKHWQPTTNAWQDVTLLDGAQLHTPDEFEFYSLAITETGDGNWKGVAGGQKWDANGGGHCGKVGWVFFTDTSLPICMSGTVWFKTTTTVIANSPVACQDRPGVTREDIYDPWDIEFEQGPTTGTPVGYMGGGTSIGFGAVWRSENAGRTWQLELGGQNSGVNTIYGVAAMADGHAVAVGYGGQVWRRDPATQPLWQCDHGFGGNGWCGAVGSLSGPLGGANGYGSDGVRITGSWGRVALSTDNAVTFTPENTSASADQSELWRLQDLHFTSPTTGFAVGQKRNLVTSTDAGKTWTLVPGFNGANGPLTKKLQSIAFDELGRGVAVGDAFLPAPATACASVSDQCPLYYTTDGGATWQASASPGLLKYGAATLAELRDVTVVTDPASPGISEFWAVGNMKVSTVVGSVPVILRSVDGGASWTHVLDFGVLPLNTHLAGVAFRTPTEGYVVGHAIGSMAGRAFRIQVGVGVSLQAVPVSYPQPLNAIATNGTLIMAVGDHVAGVGGVLEYDGVQFVDAGAPIQPLSMKSISMPASGFPVVVGCEGRPEEAVAANLGVTWTFNGSSWCPRRALTTKTVQSIYQRDGMAWAIGLGNSISPEFGQVADSIIVHYPGQ
jgi:photosystem II stability/assembly factor-like uncharacterized protein